MSKEALRRFGGRRRGECAYDHGAEDVEFGRCMEKLGASLTEHSGTKKLMQENYKTKIRGLELLLLFEIVLQKLCTNIGTTSNFLLIDKSGVKTGDSRDALGRSRFHCFNPETHLHGGYPDWYYQYDKYGAKKV